MSQDSGLRDQIVSGLKWACGHFQDDPECAELTAVGIEELVQARLDEQAAEIEKWRKGDMLWHNEARKMAEAGDRERERADRAGEQMRRERQHKLIAVKRAEQAEAKHRDMLKALRDAEAENARLREALGRVQAAIESERAGVLEREAMDGSRVAYDAVLNACAHIEAALTDPPEHGIRAALDQAPVEEANQT